MKVCALLFLAMQTLNPPPPSLSPPLITVSAPFSASHPSSLHHGKEVKIVLALTPPFLRTFIPSSRPIFSSLHSNWPSSPQHHCLVSSFFMPTICLSLQKSHLSIFFPLLFYRLPSQLPSSLLLTSSNRLSFCGAQTPLSLSVSGMKDKDL